MSSVPPKALRPADLVALGPEREAALLAYCNLPPVGCFDDGRGPVTSGAEHELPDALRLPLLERRGSRGAFRAVGELCGIPCFGPAELASILARLEDLGRYANRVRPVWGGPESSRALFELVESATGSIHIETYILGGAVGLRLVEALARKQSAGVRVRVMSCASGLVVAGSPSGSGFTSRWSEMRSWLVNDRRYARRSISRAVRENGIPFVDSSPIGRHWHRRELRAAGVRSPRDYYGRWARERGIPSEWLAEQERVDRAAAPSFGAVDHRKMVIVDGERAFVGGQNLADSYLYENELAPGARENILRWQWHDCSAILEGPAVAKLARLFAQRWILSGGDRFDPEDGRYSPPPRRAGTAVVAVETSIPGMVRLPLRENLPGFAAALFGAGRRPFTAGTNPIRERLMHLPALARDEFLAEHCYPSDGELVDNWARLAGGVRRLTLVVPLHYDTSVLGQECDCSYPRLLAGGVDLRGYGRAILHSKIAVVDGWYAMTGSYNLTLRSSRADLEILFAVQCPAFGGAVRDRILGDLAECRPVAPGALARFRSRHSLPVVDAVLRYALF